MFRYPLGGLIDLGLNETALAALDWRDFGNGLFMARLARRHKQELVLYRIGAEAAEDAFLRHEHLGGEFYLVLQGKIVDEFGEYESGDLVFLDPGSTHTPRAVGDTLVLVFWPEGVRVEKAGERKTSQGG